MTLKPRIAVRAALLISLTMSLTVLSSRSQASPGMGTCGGAMITLPFGDVDGANVFFCSIAGAYFSGLTNGTTPTTYSPAANVTREQMAAFVTRTMDQSLKRGSRRAALGQYWTPPSADGLGLTTVGANPLLVASDGTDLWVASINSASVARVRASDGKVLDAWTGATGADAVLAAKGMIYVTGDPGSGNPGKLYKIDPALFGGAVTTLTSSLGVGTIGLAFDGVKIWTANNGGTLSIVDLSTSVVTPVAGFPSPSGIFYDGATIWLTDAGTVPGKLFKLFPGSAVVDLTIPVGNGPSYPIFDGTNVWVPNHDSNSVTVVRASTGVVLATLTFNGLNGPWQAAFDGERILVTNRDGNSVSLWKASDLSPLGSVSIGPTSPYGVCSDGLNFWITLQGPSQLARF